MKAPNISNPITGPRADDLDATMKTAKILDTTSPLNTSAFDPVRFTSSWRTDRSAALHPRI